MPLGPFLRAPQFSSRTGSKPFMWKLLVSSPSHQVTHVIHVNHTMLSPSTCTSNNLMSALKTGYPAHFSFTFNCCRFLFLVSTFQPQLSQYSIYVVTMFTSGRCNVISIFDTEAFPELLKVGLLPPIASRYLINVIIW